MSLLLLSSLSLLACKEPGSRQDSTENPDTDLPQDTDQPCQESPWYADRDADGFGDLEDLTMACDAPLGSVSIAGDCDDLDPEIHPDASEVCDGGVDNDCDGLADDQDDSLDPSGAQLYFPDQDGDGFGDSSVTGEAFCARPADSVRDHSDCDDREQGVNPEAQEVCNDGLDNDCSGDAPECLFSGDYKLKKADAVFSGEDSGDSFGQSFVLLDPNNTAQQQLAVAAHEAGNHAGSVYLFKGPYGSNTKASAASWSVASDYKNTNYGYDIDALPGGSPTGADALIVGSADSLSALPAVSIYFGGSAGLSRTKDLQITAVYAGSDFGEEVTSLGDLGAKGGAAFAIGAPQASSDRGVVYIWMDTPAADTGADQADFIVSGGSSENLGHRGSVGSGDWDGDGYLDLFLGAPALSRAYIEFAVPSTGSWSTDDLSVQLQDETGTLFGYTSSSGDLDGDGYSDLVISAPLTTGAQANTGTVYIFQGGSGAWSPSMSPSHASVAISGQSERQYSGASLATGDLNQDGVDDLLFGDATNNGQAALFYGPVSGVSKTSQADATFLGYSQAGCGWNSVAIDDVDSDGIDDVAVGCDRADSLRVFFGMEM